MPVKAPGAGRQEVPCSPWPSGCSRKELSPHCPCFTWQTQTRSHGPLGKPTTQPWARGEENGVRAGPDKVKGLHGHSQRMPRREGPARPSDLFLLPLIHRGV